ncbi:TetR/AcrR family transcriptional regulator [Streptomyces armeniacus]|uniref:TetR/AcrR family transcriptional regulator n=1 Tax=Streptomyces armeniacus TaxID=83291 RepID=A0A345XSC4_9ACTN|nr:TetR/AcrR family transcriptional regulator [Streptomyces armeniacus]
MREAVLKATQEVLGDTGLALSTKEIARRAGVAESSIFYHFGDRLGLLQAVVGQYLPVFSDVAEVLGPRPAGDEGDGDGAEARTDPRAALLADLTEVVSGLEQFYVRIMPILGALQSDSQLRELLVARQAAVGPHQALRPVAALLRARRAAGRVRGTLDPDAGALLLIGAAHQRALHRHLLGPDAERFLPPAGAVAETLLPAFE